MQKIVVASKNPVKIQAAKIGFEKMFPEGIFELEGCAVPSGVSDQPMSDQETLDGAWNRVRGAKAQIPEANFWIGIEGGIEQKGDDMLAMAWVAILSKDQKGHARSGAFPLPPEVVRLINEGKELGEADDIVFKDSNSKQKGGAVGLLTNQLMDRCGLYADTVVLALIPFINKNLY